MYEEIKHITTIEAGKIRIMAADEKGNIFNITLDTLCAILEKLKEPKK